MGFQNLEKYGDSPCLFTEEQKSISYIELSEISDKMISHFNERSLFALYFFPTKDCIAAYLGALRNNHVVLLIDPNLNEDLKDSLLDKFSIENIFNGEKWIKRKLYNHCEY